MPLQSYGQFLLYQKNLAETFYEYCGVAECPSARPGIPRGPIYSFLPIFAFRLGCPPRIRPPPCYLFLPCLQSSNRLCYSSGA
jgi:hypothetical protein